MKYVKFILFICILISIININSAHKNHKLKIKKSIERPHYDPTWESIDARPLPSWYDEAKFGIFIHWGVYAVPSYGTEWFWFYWRGQNKSDFVEYMEKNYKKGFTYQEFAPLLTAEFFNPDRWAEIFKNSGAQYVVLTSKHHEGFTMWPSTYSFSWNAKDVGPQRDIVGELAASIRKNTNLKFGLYYSLFEWFNPLFLHDQLRLFLVNNYAANKAIPELKEIVNKYHPEVIWSDGDSIAPPSYWKSREFLAWLYNDSPVRDTVVTNDRWGTGSGCHHGGYRTCTDRFNPGVLQDHKFENAMTIDKYSWAHRSDANLEDFLTSTELIKELVTTVSCGGNLLLNVGPDRFGVIQPIFVDRLTDIGKWLKINGEAIYKSVPYKYQNDTITPNVWYTMQKTEKRNYVYATVLDYPYKENSISLYAVHGEIDENLKIYLLGYSEPLIFKAIEDHLVVKFPPKQDLDVNGLNWAWTLKMVLNS